ncbi:hypothetical protein BHF69_05405 [Anaerostipes sp. 992a]|uniref:glycosyltransferase family 2 protein n=1 Tax=Anaerostipes sp. 992a TaxID=1261637 RepID=UPI0009517AFE|nr:glycosyltransferase family 2 protein [Anaerostipes sp. 992a]OLR62167.1 hypothetical protein BHF69_05405 [Anaerostipes sp. 992a]
MSEVISVIVPIFNSEKTLERCINSIKNSKYNDLEIILVDDGSTDRSGQICDELTANDNRIKVFHLKNGGVSKARNFGLEQASGSLVSFIDSDDYIKSDYFWQLKKTLSVGKCQLAMGTIANVNKGKKTIVYAKEGQVNFERGSDEDRRLFLEWNKTFLLYGPVNKLYRMEIIRENNICFPEDTSYGEDLLFNLLYLRCINDISYQHKPIYYYDHDNENSLSHKYRYNLFENGLRINMALKNLFIEKGFFFSKEEAFVYRRIFDDAYNSIFDLWNPLCTLGFGQKINRVRSILSQEEVIHACKVATTTDYSQMYVFMMQKKMSVLLALLRAAMKIKRDVDNSVN